MFCLWQKTGVYTLTTQWKFLLHNPTQWQFFCLWQKTGVCTLITQSQFLHNESSSVCDRKQVCAHWLHNPSSYTVRVLLFVIENRCVYTDYTIPVPTQWEFFCLWRCLHKPMQWELCLVGWHVGLWFQWLMGFGLAPGCDRVKGHFSVPVLWVNSCAHSAVPVLPLYKFTVCTRTSMH